MTEQAGRWIMLTKKPPTRPSPGKFSIFYSHPAPNIKIMDDQEEKYFDPSDGKWFDYAYLLGDRRQERGTPEAPRIFTDYFGFREDNALHRRVIHFMGHDIVVTADEYEFKSPEQMRELIFQPEGEEIYKLVENGEASKRMLQIALDTDLRMLYDAALLDGCNWQMAEMVAMGMDVSDVELEFPPVGFYQPVLGRGVWETFAELGEPIGFTNQMRRAASHRKRLERCSRRVHAPALTITARRWKNRNVTDEYWMLRESPPLSEEEIMNIGRSREQEYQRQLAMEARGSVDDSDFDYDFDMEDELDD